MFKALSQRQASTQSASAESNLQSIADEIEALQFTLQQHEHKVLSLPSDTIQQVQLTVLPSKIDGRLIRVAVGDELQHMQYEFLPRVLITLKLDPEVYPSKSAPEITITGFYQLYHSFILDNLNKRFEPGFTCLFDWFTYIKDELFFDPNSPYEYSTAFFHHN
jgi:hypothetical protein